MNGERDLHGVIWFSQTCASGKWRFGDEISDCPGHGNSPVPASPCYDDRLSFPIARQWTT